MGTSRRQTFETLEIDDVGNEMDILREKEGTLHTFEDVHVKTECKHLVKMFMRGRGFRTTNEVDSWVSFRKERAPIAPHPNAHIRT